MKPHHDSLNAGSLSRRAVLGLLGAGGLGLATGCSIDTGGEQGSGSDPTKIDFPDYPTELPTEDVTFRWVDSGDLKSVWEKSVLDAFAAKHPNIKTQYDGSGWDTVNQVVPLGIRNKSAHDMFALPLTVPPQIAINEGWVRPIEDLIPDFAAWRAKFPETVLVPGVNTFDDKVYSWPIASNRRLERMAIFDAANMTEAGYDDPGTQIKTWDDMTEALGKVVKAGKAGLMVGGDGLGGIVNYLAYTAGWRGIMTGMDMKTGEYIFDAPEIQQAYEFLQKLATDKLIVPGFLTLLEKDARAQMTAAKAGAILNGPWDIPAWKKTAPSWKYQIASLPSPEGKPFMLPFLEGANSSWVYADTKLPTVAGQILAYMGSPEGQKMMVIMSQGNLQSLQPEANTAADQPGLLDENAKIAVGLAKKSMFVAPRPELRNKDAAKVALALKPVTPTWNQILQGLFSGELDNPSSQLAKYNIALSAALDDAITSAKAKGSTATRDDYVFGNWDPSKDYTEADYQALG